jgi:hypothetical protein
MVILPGLGPKIVFFTDDDLAARFIETTGLRGAMAVPVPDRAPLLSIGEPVTWVQTARTRPDADCFK